MNTTALPLTDPQTTTARTVWAYCAVRAVTVMTSDARRIAHLLALDPKQVAQILTWPIDLERRLRDSDASYDSLDCIDMWAVSTITSLMESWLILDGHLDALACDLIVHFGDDRTAIARQIKHHPHRGVIWHMLRGGDPSAYLWRTLRPRDARPYAALPSPYDA